MKPQVDGAGYDLVIDSNGVTRPIQLKRSFKGAKTASQKVIFGSPRSQADALSGSCLSPRPLNSYLWFDSKPGKPLPSLSSYKIARHTKGNAKGEKAERPMLRVVPRSRFVQLPSIEAVLEQLFGPPKPRGSA